MMFGSFVHLVASKFPALQIAVLIILKFMHFIKKVGDGQVDLEQIEKEKQHDAKTISEIWGAGFASAWTHTFITLPGDESRSPKQLQMGETVPNSEPMKQITAPFLDSCGDNAVDADDSKFMRFIKKVGDGQVVSPFLFVLNQHAQKIPEIWSADFASAWTYGLMFGYATDETEECMPLTVALAHRLNARLAALRKDGTFPWAGPDSKTQDGDGDMECPPRGSGPRNRPPYRSSPKDRRRPRRGRQSRPRADSGAPRGKRDDGDAPNKSDAADDYESKSDEPGNTHENNSDNVNVSPSSNQLSSGSGEPSDSAQTNEGYSNENSSEQERDDFLHKLTSVEDWLYGEGGRTGSCLQRKLNELKKLAAYPISSVKWADTVGYHEVHHCLLTKFGIQFPKKLNPVTGTSRESCREQKKDVLIKNMERKMGLSQTSVYYGVYFDGLKEAFNKDQLLISPPVIVLKIMLQAIFQPV